MATPPRSTKTSLDQRLTARARDRWPALAHVDDVCQRFLINPVIEAADISVSAAQPA